MELLGFYPNKSIRENYLKAVEFRYPEWIPCSVAFSLATWSRYREKLEDVMIRHPLIFSYHKKGSVNFDFRPPCYKKGEYFRDRWGCLWYNVQDGLEGQVVENPLANWEMLDTYQPPDPLTETERGDMRDWEMIKRSFKEAREKGLLTVGDGERLFDRLYFLRGFRNLMIDIVKDDPRLPRLIKIVEDYEMKLINKWLEIGVDVISFHTDIGTQNGLMISPAKFRKYIKPMFKKLFTTCREAGVHVYLSSDGRLVDIVDDLVECGVSIHDPQLRANTLKGIAKAYKGRLCIDLDLDRQAFPFCSPSDIRQMVRDAVERLYLPEGGLMMKAEFFGADVPLDNIEAVCQAMEDFCIRLKAT